MRVCQPGLALVIAQLLRAMSVPVSAQDDAAAVEGLLTAVVDRINARDAVGLGGLLHDDALFVLDMPYDGLILDKAGVLDGPQGLMGGAQRPVSFALTDLQVWCQVGFCRGTIEVEGAGDEAGFFAAAVPTPTGWKLLLLAIATPAEPPAGVPVGLTAIAEQIMRGDVNGMQAGARYVAKQCVFALGLPNAPMEFASPQLVTQSVSTWAPPQEVEITAGGEVLVNRMSALLTFDSSLLTGPTRLDLHNVVCLVQAEGTWRVLGFIAAAKAAEVVQPAP